MPCNGAMDLEPLTLPAAAAEPHRQPIPVLAAVVPIVAGVVLWLVTGSIFSLCFAALGPLMIGASLLDGLRNRRRERRAAADDETAGWRRAEQDLLRRHQSERRELRRAHPDAAACLQDAPLRDLQPVDESTPIVVGSGARRSALRVTGDDSERARGFRKRAAHVTDVPISVPMGRGICLRGPAPVVAAAARALVVQLCLRHAPGQLALVGGGLETLGLADFPHAGRPRRGAWRLAVVMGDEDCTDAAAQVRVCETGQEVPEGVTTLIDCVDPSSARLRTSAGVEDIAVECLSRAQAAAIAASSIEREGESAHLPDTVTLGELTPPDGAGISGLAAVIGRTESADIVLDLVEDGPHAIVTGMTGSGKSELLVTWITSMARTHRPDEVSFVLADFKGGTAFDPLRALPHVAAVMTDLDEEGARRGVESLTAELRRRESALAECGARNITEAAGRLGRLVIVVDEFAALLQEHHDLGAVFTDVAARGRALGMHLILGTQRAAGVIRDGLAANCPLRVSLRVTEPADSRLVIGSDDAAELPGGASSRGLAFVRRPQDMTAVAVRVALTGAADLRDIGSRWPDAAVPASPWHPALPLRLDLAALSAAHPPGASLLVGLTDVPERQCQTPMLLRPGIDRGLAVIGGSGSGRTAALRTLAEQAAQPVLLGADPERAWDVLADVLDAAGDTPKLVLCDDLDQLVASFPVEYGQVFLERMEKLVRSAAARGCTVVVATGRASGQTARVIEALPTRMLLRMGTKMEHLAAGGDADGYRRDRPAGRARVGRHEVQVAWTDEAARVEAAVAGVERWTPAAQVVGVIALGVRRVVEGLRGAYPDHAVVPVTDRAQEPPTSAPQAGASALAHAPDPAPTILVGDADSWQRQWPLWQRIRLEGEMLFLAECAGELRSFAGSRELPPYAKPHVGRAWTIHEGLTPRRVVIPELDATAR